jgi:hypothetical protein
MSLDQSPITDPAVRPAFHLAVAVDDVTHAPSIAGCGTCLRD